MAWQGRSVLAVVPARGGSKGIPRKNLREVAGVSLVGRAAALASAADWIDATVISTDDEEIRDEAVRHGAHAPFMRPDSLASDTATSTDMWQHAWRASEAHYGRRFDISVLLEPTSPLRTLVDIERTLTALVDSGEESAATVSPTPAHYTPHKTLTKDADDRLGFYVQGGAGHTLRQSIPDYFHRNGVCYAVTRSHLLDHGRILDEGTLAVIIDRHLVNIDEPWELEFAEWLLGRAPQT